MKPSGTAVLGFVLICAGAHAADATTPIDYRARNTPFAPAGSVTPEKSAPEKNARVQEKRVEKNTVEKTLAAVGDRRAAVEVQETREKIVREMDSRRPETVAQPMSALNQQPAAWSTSADTKRPPTVAKYQDSLAAASATNMARFPAMDRATTAKLNRFVFRKNPPPRSSSNADIPVVPAAGGSVRSK